MQYCIIHTKDIRQQHRVAVDVTCFGFGLLISDSRCVRHICGVCECVRMPIVDGLCE